ncbi:hypothetical protein ACP4OV_007668 [Aristida adscensionis]
MLPTDILISILEKLALRDAVRAGALSWRWRSLPAQLPRLVLDYQDFLAVAENHDDDDVEHYYAALAESADAMLTAAAALLASRGGGGGGEEELPVSLAVRFLLRHNYMPLGRVLDDAVAGGKVRALELTVSTRWQVRDGGVHDAISMVRHGRRFRNLFGRCPAVFGGLTRLELENTLLGSSDEFGDVLDACARLEQLSLTWCAVEPKARWWRVHHSRLADLRISRCFFHNVDLAWLPRLESFACIGWLSPATQRPISFGHVPRLETLALSNIHTPTVKLSEILANTAVTNLRLNFGGLNVTTPLHLARDAAYCILSSEYTSSVIQIRNSF